jgi:hypothetical protein
LKRRKEDVGAPAGTEVEREFREEPCGDLQAVGSSIQGEVLQAVGVPELHGRGQVGRVAEHDVEPA